MADFVYTLEAQPILGKADITLGANRILERDNLALVSVAIPSGETAEIAAAFEKGWGLALPEPRGSTVHGASRAVWTAPDQILLMFPHSSPTVSVRVSETLEGAGYVTDQTDAWVALEVSGPDTGAAMERLCPLDLSLSAFPTNASARTIMEHLGAFVVRIDDERLLLLSARSSARSFLHAVEVSYRNVCP